MTLEPDHQTAWHDLAAVLGAKYAPHVLFALEAGDQQFSTLRRELAVTPSTLTRRLDSFVCRGFVSRRVEATSPPTTWYALTDAGETVVRALSTLDEQARLVACGDDTCARLSRPEPSCCI